MSDANKVEGHLQFSVDSSLLFQLGEQLVARASVALAELIKNAYDADATKVTITMENIEEEGGTILIEDDGHGMTFEELQAYWMRIATNSKQTNPVSRIYKRALTGAKGVGRFAARRLGNKLLVQSVALRPDGSKEIVSAEFKWKEFLPGKDINQVPVDYTRSVVSLDTPTGVQLLIQDARDAWIQTDLSELRRDILSLQSPFPDLVIKPNEMFDTDGQLPDPGFNMFFEIEGSGELEDLSGGLGEAFLEAAWARLEGKIDAEGKAHYSIYLLQDGQEDIILDSTNEYTELKEAQFRIFFFVYLKEYFDRFDFGVREGTKKGREQGGVRVFLDGFRVFPYGEPTDDWLQLAEQAAKNINLLKEHTIADSILAYEKTVTNERPFLLAPRNNQLFGAVSISQIQHSKLGVNISRQKLIESATEKKLIQFVKNGLWWMTLKYAAATAAEREKRRIQWIPRTTREVLDEVKTIIHNETVPNSIKVRIIEAVNEAIKLDEEKTQERISEISMLRILASAGTTIIQMNHQLQAIIAIISEIEQKLSRLRPHLHPSLHTEYDNIVERVRAWGEMVNLQVSQLGLLLSPDSRQRRYPYALYEIVQDVFKTMSYYMTDYNIQFENNVPKNLRVPSIYKSELYAILINILSNALKAVYGQDIRIISVNAEKKAGILYFRMMDTGKGLDEKFHKDPELAFKPFETTSLPNPVLGVGTGLGLKVVQDILDLYAGKARFVDVEPPWKTCIEIRLPERG